MQPITTEFYFHKNVMDRLNVDSLYRTLYAVAMYITTEEEADHCFDKLILLSRQEGCGEAEAIKMHQESLIQLSKNYSTETIERVARLFCS